MEANPEEPQTSEILLKVKEAEAPGYTWWGGPGRKLSLRDNQRGDGGILESWQKKFWLKPETRQPGLKPKRVSKLEKEARAIKEKTEEEKKQLLEIASANFNQAVEKTTERKLLADYKEKLSSQDGYVLS